MQWPWRTLLWGIGLQLIFALLIFRTSSGSGALQWLGKKVEVQYTSYHCGGGQFVTTGISVDSVEVNVTWL